MKVVELTLVEHFVCNEAYFKLYPVPTCYPVKFCVSPQHLNTIGHLKHMYDISGVGLKWFVSYLSDRRQYIKLWYGICSSSLKYCYTTGLSLQPIQFSIYFALL